MKKTLGFLSFLALAALGHAASATYRVTQKIGSLSAAQSSVVDPYLFLEFQLTNGPQSGDNSVVRITNLTLAGGTVAYDDRRLADLGLVTGTGTDFTLHNVGGAGVSDRAVLFRVGSGSAVLSYDFTLTNSGLDAPIPDGFNVAMLYRTGEAASAIDRVGTLGPTGSEMVGYGLTKTAKAPAAYGVDPTFVSSRLLSGDRRFVSLGAPGITPVPEPSALAAIGLGTLGLLRRRKRA